MVFAHCLGSRLEAAGLEPIPFASEAKHRFGILAQVPVQYISGVQDAMWQSF